MRVLGLDETLNNMGLAWGHLNKKNRLEIVGIDLFTTTASRKNRALGDAKRIRYLFNKLRPYVQKTDLVCAELVGGGQSYRAAFSLAVGLTLAVAHDKPVKLVKPKDVKMQVLPGATKAQIIKWAVQKYPHLNWRYSKRDGQSITIKGNEHMADAIAIVHAALYGNSFMI